MNDFKRMSDEKLAIYIIDYIRRTDKLMQIVSDYMEGKTDRSATDFIHAEYRDLKLSIKDDAHYINLSENRAHSESLYNTYFVPSISEASAEGFSAPTNSTINSKMFSSLYDAHYKLTKYYSLKDWENIAYHD